MPSDGASRLRLVAAGLCAAGGAVVLVAAGGRDAGVPVPVSAGTTVPVVVAGRDLGAGSVLGTDDVRVRAEPDGDVSRGLVHDRTEVVGRRLLIAVVVGAPLMASEVAADLPPDPLRRTVQVMVPAAGSPSAIPSGSEVEVVASTGDTAATHRVAVIAVCRLMGESGAGSAGARAGEASPGSGVVGGRPEPQVVTVSLDCPAAAALRVLYASDFAAHVRVLVHPLGATSPAAADGAT